MLNWQIVESALYRGYFSLFENGNLAQSGAAYYSLDSFGAKLRLVDATAGAVLKAPKLDAWVKLHKALKSASSERNFLAHLPAELSVNADQSLSLVLAPHFYIPFSLRRKRSKSYDAPECERLAFASTNWQRKSTFSQLLRPCNNLPITQDPVSECM